MIHFHTDLTQGSDEWLAARCGLLTASEMKHIVTPTLKPARNEKEKSHLYELLAQRLSGYVEPHYIGDDMLRGMEDEVIARQLYAEKYLPVREVGFITNDKWGFTLGYSPDGLVGNDGLLECKSRRQKHQVRTIIENEPPEEYQIQIQTGLLVAEKNWLDFVTYSGGLPMLTIRVFPDPRMQEAIIDAASDFEKRLRDAKAQYLNNLNPPSRTIPTERRIIQEMFA